MPVKRFASEIFNALPDRVNMFGRYITGFGGDGLKLDKSTENALVRATEKPPISMVNTQEVDHDKTVEAFEKAKETGKFEPVFTGRMIDKPVAAIGPGIPTSGPVSTPYTKGSSKEVTQTLGRFNAQVTPQEVTLTDRYDMVNEHEDPDLVSGKFQPGKAFNNLIGTFDPAKEFDIKTGKLKDVSHRNTSQEEYDKQRAESPTSSKATELARSLMYLLPIKPKGYDVNYTIKR